MKNVSVDHKVISCHVPVLFILFYFCCDFAIFSTVSTKLIQPKPKSFTCVIIIIISTHNQFNKQDKCFAFPRGHFYDLFCLCNISHSPTTRSRNQSRSIKRSMFYYCLSFFTFSDSLLDESFISSLSSLKHT